MKPPGVFLVLRVPRVGSRKETCPTETPTDPVFLSSRPSLSGDPPRGSRPTPIPLVPLPLPRHRRRDSLTWTSRAYCPRWFGPGPSNRSPVLPSVFGTDHRQVRTPNWILTGLRRQPPSPRWTTPPRFILGGRGPYSHDRLTDRFSDLRRVFGFT